MCPKGSVAEDRHYGAGVAGGFLIGIEVNDEGRPRVRIQDFLTPKPSSSSAGPSSIGPSRSLVPGNEARGWSMLENEEPLPPLWYLKFDASSLCVPGFITDVPPVVR